MTLNKKSIPSKVPYRDIRWLVGNISVAKTHAEVAQDIVTRLETQATDRELAYSVAIALHCHDENRGLVKRLRLYHY